MKKNLLLIITILTCFIFINTVKAEDIPKGDYTTHKISYENLQIVDPDGNPVKEATICFNDDYSDEYCYDMTLQDNGLYKDYEKTYTCNSCSWSENNTEEEWESSFYIKVDGYLNTKIYYVTDKAKEEYSIDSSNKVTDKYTSTYYDGSKKIEKITLEKSKSNQCYIVNGTGKNIGDEIVCGTEHFYVISNDGKEVKMMAKYNLYVGANWNRYVLANTYSFYDWTAGKTIAYVDGKQVDGYYNALKDKFSLSGIGYNIEYLYRTNRGTYGYIYSNSENTKSTKLYTYTNINYDEEGYALQNSKALGVTGEKGNANYPIIATTLLFPYYEDYLSDSVSSLDNFEDGYTNFELNDNNEIKGYLNIYAENLKRMGYDVTSTNLISMEELNDLVKNITNKELPLSDWYNDANNQIEDDIYELGTIKNYLPDAYSWLWNTSYWTRTAYGNNIKLSGDTYDYKFYFVSTQGTICYSESDCWGTIPRAGIRPIVTMSADQIYNVYTKDDGNGTITYERKDGVVHFTLTPKEGYVLGEVKVTDADGNTITFTDYTFTMPSADVTIEAIFKKIDNPLTSDIAIITILVLAITSLVIFSIQAKKFKKIIKE